METETQVKIEIGTIYVDDIGQFYEVIKVNAKTLTLRAIAAIGSPFLHSTPIIPRPGEYVEAYIGYVWVNRTFTRRLTGWPGRYATAVKIDKYHGLAHPWEGEVKHSEHNYG